MENVNYKQCLACSVKHLAAALVEAAEICNGYDEDQHKLMLLGNLTEAEMQIANLVPGMAAVIRKIRKEAVPEALPDKDLLTEEWKKRVQSAALTLNDMQSTGRQDVFRVNACSCKEPLDVLIPLKYGGSKSNNDELRFALRSIEKHLKNCRNVWIVTEKAPEGFRDLHFVPVQDRYPRKQMNICNAVFTALEQPDFPEKFLFWADDNVLLRELDARFVPVVSRRGSLHDCQGEGKWHQSVRDTGKVLQAAKLGTLDFEAHVPVLFHKSLFLKLREKFNFFENAGLCYISLYLNTYRKFPEFFMNEVKATFESGWADYVGSVNGKLFAGYNDSGFSGGFREYLRTVFPQKSRFEC